ncbi:hypothetical protein Back11_33790 [Paenibacillus baekrokdamisoli]|uniref:Uncharacterized protein n=1 Tax=Paenibacillus baekrokdamisoli TaxID=1712516 RepID=A0A3G9JFT9_9BACL|nr:S-layer homology domain-containing protein [Paenibacillus baekrokdamisoli]MBB3073361.1 hypothetical protein [Paenibacillus baekrokdamisoli]BBH22034.1 hypothetical protein Back11_33790 [Paenibacillus baekrokdamisoli]
MLKKISCCILIAAILLTGFMGTGLQAQVSAAEKSTSLAEKTEDHWAAAELQTWKDYGIINGYSDGSLRPDNEITRAEFVVMLGRVFNFSQGSVNPFKDVPAAAWYADALSKAYTAGIISGMGDGKFQPNRSVSREEAAKMIAVAFDLEPASSSMNVKDLNEISDWAVPYVNALFEHGYISGRGDHHRFAPKANLTRAEMIKILDNVVDKLVDVDGLSGITINGNVVVKNSPVTLKDLVINGDLLLAPGMTAGEVVLENVTVKGRLLIQGSPVSGVSITSSHLGIVKMTAAGTKLTLAATDISQMLIMPSASNSLIKSDKESRIGHLENKAKNVVIDADRVQDTERDIPPVNNGDNGNPPVKPDPLISKVSYLAFGQSGQETASQLRFTGNSSIDTIGTKVGELEDSYKVRYMQGKGSAITFTLTDLKPNQPVTVEIEEIHSRNPDAFAYTVLANDQEVYFRTYREASAGPNHYFIDLNASIIGGASSLTLTLRNDSPTRVNFAKVWAYSNFESLLADEHIYRPMTVALFKPNIKWNDHAADLALLNGIKQKYADYEMYNIAVVFDILYMHWSEKEMKRRLDYLTQLSADSGLAIHLSVDSWWDGTPIGPDGQGGYWRDMPYQQVVYDPLNTDGRGNWKLSTPNVWGNTPWLTMNNEHYNEVRADKIRGVTAYLAARTADLKADGVELPPVVVFTENEPWYWPYFAFNASPEGTGDFGPEVIAAAANDGVLLDPTDGISVQERQWLAKNMTDYISTVSNAMAEGYGYNAIIVDNGQITYPDNQLVENAFTHTFTNQKFPGLDEQQSLWEAHMVKNIRFGGEWEDILDDRYLSYIAARGKFADVNAERGANSMQDFQVLPQAYAYGADHVTIYNYRSGDESIIRSNDVEMSDPYSTPSYGKVVIDYNFADEQSLTTGISFVETNQVKRGPLLENYVVSSNTGDANGGYITFKADNQGVPLTHGLAVELAGRSLNYLCSLCKVEVWAGPELNQLSLVDTLKDMFHTATIDASDYIDPSSSIAYVRIRLYSPNLPSQVFDWVSLSSVKITALLGRASGHTSGLQYTFKQLRERNLWVTYRADIERLLAKYVDQAGQNDMYKEIDELYRSGYYGKAYKRLMEAMSQLLPAKFVVKGSGTLGDYPLSMQIVDTAAKIHTTLYTFGNSFKIGFVADAAATVSLTLTHATSAYYKAVDLGGGIYEISPTQANDAGAIAVTGGKATFALNAPTKPAKTYPSEIEARYYSKSGTATINIQSQDPAISEYVNYIDLKLADQVIILRGPKGTPDQELQQVPIEMLDYGDLLKLTLNQQGEVVSLKAYYGKVSGTITKIQPVTVTGQLQNAFVELRDSANKEYRFEMGQDSQFNSPNAKGTNVFNAPINDWGFKVGDLVTISYSPYAVLGRAKRVLGISEQYDTMLFENFEETGEAWRTRADEVHNILKTRLDSNNQDIVLRPDNIASPGIATWKLESATPFEGAAIQYSGRAIMGTTVEWEMSVTGSEGTWQKVGEIANDADSNSFNQLRDINLDIANLNTNTLYVRVVMTTSNPDTWASINSVKFIVKRTGIRELDTASLTWNNSVVYEGQNVPVVLTAKYDNDDTVNLAGAKIVYAFGTNGILAQTSNGLSAIGAGTTTVKAYLSVQGKVVSTNTITVSVTANTLGHMEMMPADAFVPINGTVTAEVKAYNEQNNELQPSLYKTVYTSSDVSVATVSANGIVTGISYGTANITAVITFHGLSLSKFITVTVAQPVALVDEDFQDIPIGTITAEVIGANEVVNLQNELLFESLPDIGLTGTPNDAGGKQAGYVIYKLDSTDSNGFKKLEMLYSGRTLHIDEDRIAAMRFYVGTDVTAMTKIGELSTSAPGNYDTIRTLDLTEQAKGHKTVYLKIEIESVAYTWGFLNSVKVIDYATGV